MPVGLADLSASGLASLSTKSKDSVAITCLLFLETQLLITCIFWYRRQEFRSGVSSSGIPIIGDVRGRGLMLGVELVTDRQLNFLVKVETMHVMEKMKDLGVLVGTKIR